MKDYFNIALEKIKEIIKIKSVKEKALKNKPFGDGVYNALNYFLNTAKSLGFEVKNYDNYIGEVIFGEGNDENGFAVLCHLDVVPEGDDSKWTFPPYSATENNGYLYGRGVVDNKAPAVLCLYALKQLKDEGFIPNKKIKLIVGCDEESGWECIKHYKKVAVMPKTGFSPDGDFPVIYAEKGILHLEYSFNAPKNLKAIMGGERTNVVCEKVEATFDNLSKNQKEEFLKDGLFVNENSVKAYGKPAHASRPNLGENALEKLLFSLSKQGVLAEIYEKLFKNQAYFSNIYDETGSLTFSPDVCLLKNRKIKVLVDVRYPSTFTKNEVLEALKKVGKFKILHFQKPIMCDKESELVKTLLSVYNEEFNENEAPIAIGGGTYARALEKGVAFGPSKLTDNECHSIDEKMKISDMEKYYKVYLKAIKKLND
ncbi:MAG: Sapep family Mn(2+)-dependent dipeptidase [Clostridia bacterium]|nr:Sapep family Mn(2+)-dependent dipeptidase [Clostridia bacterium]